MGRVVFRQVAFRQILLLLQITLKLFFLDIKLLKFFFVFYYYNNNIIIYVYNKIVVLTNSLYYIEMNIYNNLI